MGNEVERLKDGIDRILYRRHKQWITDTDVRSEILTLIAEAGYICVGKGDTDAPSEVCSQCQGIGEILIPHFG